MAFLYKTGMLSELYAVVQKSQNAQYQGVSAVSFEELPALKRHVETQLHMELFFPESIRSMYGIML